MRSFVDKSTVQMASWVAPRGVTRLEYNVAREALASGAKLVRFDDILQGFVAAELPAHFGQAPDPVKILLTGTPTVRAPFSKRRVIRRMALLGELLSKAWPMVPEPEIEAAREELAWELAHSYEFLPVAERFELASLAHAFEPHPLCHNFRYWITVERQGISSQPVRGPAKAVDAKAGDKVLWLGAEWKHNYLDYLEKLTARGVGVAALIYDMIPITHPNFLPKEEMERFETYLARMLKSPVRLATISKSSQEEIDRYCRRKFSFKGTGRDAVAK